MIPYHLHLRVVQPSTAAAAVGCEVPAIVKFIYLLMCIKSRNFSFSFIVQVTN